MDRRSAAAALLMLVGTAMPGNAQTFPPVAPLPAPASLPAQAQMPDPLVMLDGSRVTTSDQWRRERRPELLRLFQHYMYGYMPAAPHNLHAKLEREDRDALGGKATLKELTLTFGPANTPPIHLMLVVPNARKG